MERRDLTGAPRGAGDGLAGRRGGGGRRGRPGPYQRLRGIDRMYLALESPTTPMHFGALVVLDGAALCDPDGRLRLTEIRRQLDVRSRDAPPLRRIVHDPGWLAGGPLWIDDPAFAIEHHVAATAMPAPGDDAAALAFVETLMEPLLDRAHPLWRLWFITGLPAGRIGALVIVHHALADGLAAMRLAATLLGAPLGEGDISRSAADDGGPRRPGRDLLVRDHVRALVAAAAQLADPATWRVVAGFLRSFRAGWSAARREPPTSLNAMVGPRRHLATLRLDQSQVRRMARAWDVGVNDVVLDLVTCGVRALLVSRGEPIERLAPRAGIAVALRPSERGDAGNHFGSYVVPLPFGETDPVQRLRRIHDVWERAKGTELLRGVTGVRVWTTRSALTRRMMARQRYINLMETYVPGPPRPIDLLGARVLDIVPIQPLGRNVGLTFVASSYARCLTVVVRVDADGFTDLDVLLDAMAGEWESLSAG